MYERGAVWTARIPQVGIKPVVILSDQTVTLALRPIAARITSVERPRAVPTVVALAPGEVDGLAEHSYVLCHDLMTVPSDGLVEHLGSVSRERIIEIEDRITFVFGMSQAW
jgi:mRNA-degrading endonuclease toxin of MazEF toxin-antitoxin module